MSSSTSVPGPAQPTSMAWETFFARFGGALRTKNILRDVNPRSFGLPVGPPDILQKEFIRLCPWEAEYLFAVARRARVGIIETGRYNGGSLFVMACAAPDGVPLTSVDWAPKNDDRFKRFLKEVRPNADIRLITGDSQSVAYPDVAPADVLFIDGDHTYEGCMADIENWYPKLLPGGQMLFHDSYLGKHGVQDAILDFMILHPELEIVTSPVIGATYWHYPAGSIAHLRRRPV